MLERLDRLGFFNKKKAGLKNIQQIDKLLGHPHKNFPTVLIAGSNGKGSVSTKIANALSLAGYKTGLFTSPHIDSFTERIQINHRSISLEKADALLSHVFELLDRYDIQATYFEVVTAVALLAFQDANVDIAVLEVGLGGRLDATNIVTPLLCAITSISLEHTQQLGSTKEAVAKEKGGIIKERVPLILGPFADLPTLRAIAQEKKSPLIALEPQEENSEEENQRVAKAALYFLKQQLTLTNKAIEDGISFQAPCRFERFNHAELPIIFDVAHNSDAFKRLYQRIKKEFPNRKIRTLLGLSKGKEHEHSLQIIAENSDYIHLVDTNNPRSLKVKELSYALKCQVSSKIPSVKKTIELALHSAVSNEELLLVTGSFYIMKEARLSLP